MFESDVPLSSIPSSASFNTSVLSLLSLCLFELVTENFLFPDGMKTELIINPIPIPKIKLGIAMPNASDNSYNSRKTKLIGKASTIRTKAKIITNFFLVIIYLMIYVFSELSIIKFVNETKVII